jgi:hypothetical protein
LKGVHKTESTQDQVLANASDIGNVGQRRASTSLRRLPVTRGHAIKALDQIPMTARSLVLTTYGVVATSRLRAAVIWFDLFGALELSSLGFDLPVWANDNRERSRQRRSFARPYPGDV